MHQPLSARESDLTSTLGSKLPPWSISGEPIGRLRVAKCDGRMAAVPVLDLLQMPQMGLVLVFH